MRPQKKATLVYSSKAYDRATVLSTPDTSSIERLFRVVFNNDSRKRLIINRWGYHYKPSDEWKALNFKFKRKH